MTAGQMKRSVDALNAQAEILTATQEHLRIWKTLVDERFKEQAGQIQRLEFNIHIPRSERRMAERKYNLFNYGDAQ